jgi:hypothetical protein
MGSLGGMGGGSPYTMRVCAKLASAMQSIFGSVPVHFRACVPVAKTLLPSHNSLSFMMLSEKSTLPTVSPSWQSGKELVPGKSFRCIVSFHCMHFISLHAFHCNEGECKECNDATNQRQIREASGNRRPNRARSGTAGATRSDSASLVWRRLFSCRRLDRRSAAAPGLWPAVDRPWSAHRLRRCSV